MQIALHCGVHFTEDERLLKSLLRNRGNFAKGGVAVPGPGKYRKLIRELLDAMEDRAPAPDARDVLLDAILDAGTADRMILSNAHFLGPPRLALRQGVFYPQALDNLAQLTRIFARDEVEVFIALRNPATFLPALQDRLEGDRLEDFLGAYAADELRWSTFIETLRAGLPGVTLTAWCNEDAPLIWAQLIRDMADLGPGEDIEGAFDLLAAIMSPEGMKRFRSYLGHHPVMNEMQRRRVIAAFLDKFAIPGEVEEELDLPGWTEELVEDMTETYDEDVLRIQHMDGVQLITP